MQTGNKKAKAIKPDLTISMQDGTTYQLARIKKRHYMPIHPDQQETVQASGQSVELVPTPPSQVSGAKQKKLRRACATLCRACHLIEDATSAAIIILLLLLSRVMDLALLMLPGVPVILVGSAMVIPVSLKKLVATLCGPEEIRGEGWRIRRPSCIEAVIPLGTASPSVNLEQYLGGYYRDFYVEKRHLWLPLLNTASILATNLPRTVSTTIISYSPLMIPIVFGTDKALIRDRPTFTLAGTAFTIFEPELLADLERDSELIQLELDSFFKWFRAKKKRQNRWLDEANDFLPASQHGQFIQHSTKVEDYILALAMSLLKQFLRFSMEEKRGWLTADETQQFLLDYWRLVLPESAPVSSVEDDAQAVNCRWNDPLTFWTFLSGYIGEQAAKISADGAPVKREAVGVLHRLSDGPYLVFPRRLLFKSYVSWLQDRCCDIPEQGGRWETQLQTMIMDWGVPVKSEGKDVSWRFAFYRKGQTPDGLKEKLPCLAFPLSQLPPEIISALDSALGPSFVSWNPNRELESEVTADA